MVATAPLFVCNGGMAESKKYEIRVEVTTQYLADQSDPSAGRYVFAYTVDISNTGTVAAQLISRHWVITDAEGGVQEVRGLGVVGHQPLLAAGPELRIHQRLRPDHPGGHDEGQLSDGGGRRHLLRCADHRIRAVDAAGAALIRGSQPVSLKHSYTLIAPFYDVLLAGGDARAAAQEPGVAAAASAARCLDQRRRHRPRPAPPAATAPLRRARSDPGNAGPCRAAARRPAFSRRRGRCAAAAFRRRELRCRGAAPDPRRCAGAFALPGGDGTRGEDRRQHPGVRQVSPPRRARLVEKGPQSAGATRRDPSRRGVRGSADRRRPRSSAYATSRRWRAAGSG